MKIENVVDLTKHALVETFGKDVFESTYTTDGALSMDKLVDAGHDIGDDTTNTLTEKFTHALLSRLGKMEILDNDYEPLVNDLVIDSFEWGGIKERVVPQLCNIIQDEVFNKVDGKSYADLEHTFYQPKVEVKIFNEMKPITIPISISTEDTKEAFTSWDAMNRYISRLRSMVTETKKAVMDTYAHMLIDVAAAISIKATQNNVKLVTLAKAEGVITEEESTNVAALRHNDKFLAFCTRKIADTKDNMRAMSIAFNNGNFPVQARETNNYVLTQFRNAVRNIPRLNSNERIDTALDDFTGLPSWQMIKTTSGNFFDWTEVSKVSIAADPNNKLGLGTEQVDISNLVAVITDRRAMGLCPYRQKVTSSYTACADFWNEWLHLFLNYYVDSNFPIVAFTLD